VSEAERYLDEWHSRYPDATRVFAAMRDETGRSSFERLAGLVTAERIVLDVACGAGGLLALLHRANQSRRLLGVDLCEPELVLAARAVPAAALIRARAQAIPLRAQSVDAVLCHMALMLMDNPDDVLREWRRVLRPGAMLGTITNSLSVPDGVMKIVLLALRDTLRAADPSRLPPALGDTRTHDAVALAGLIGDYFIDIRVDEFHVAQTVPRDALWPFMVQSIYGFDALPDVDGSRIIAGLDLPELITWTLPLVQIQARVPR
jgi:ubiquinone/menaquinone biosynthesis C-methylase UbiE